MTTIKEKQQEIVDKLEKENLEDITVYTIEIGYHKWCTEDKEAAFKLWETLTDKFFTLEAFNDYGVPKFNWKKPLETKLSGEKQSVWKTHESANKAHVVFESLKPKKSNEE